MFSIENCAATGIMEELLSILIYAVAFVRLSKYRTLMDQTY